MFLPCQVPCALLQIWASSEGRDCGSTGCLPTMTGLGVHKGCSENALCADLMPLPYPGQTALPPFSHGIIVTLEKRPQARLGRG